LFMPPASSRSGIAASPTTGEKAREIAMGRTNVTRSIHGPARPPRLWQASSATEPVASVHHRDCRDRRTRSRRTSPALTCRDRLRAVGPSVTGRRRLQLGELCGICVARSGIAAETGNGKCRFAGAFRDGSDGTRTRDLRRDRPSRAQRRPATNASEQPHLQALFAPTPPLLRMVEPIVQSTFGPRVGHENLSQETTVCRIARHRATRRELIDVPNKELPATSCGMCAGCGVASIVNQRYVCGYAVAVLACKPPSRI
jgi:hypothetical protein